MILTHLSFVYNKNKKQQGGEAVDTRLQKIGERIKKLRKKQGKTQRFIADAINNSVQHVSNIENGNTKLSLIALINIANALEVTTDVLLCDSTYKSKAVLHDDLAELLEVADDDDVRQIVAYAQFWMETGRKINRKGE